VSESLFATMVASLEANGAPPESRPEATTEALVARFREFAKVDVHHDTVEGPHGDIAVRVYTPPDAGEVGFVWLHGGAWIGGNLDMPEAHYVALSVAAAGVPVVSADYSKALHGQHFPAPSDDVLAAWDWAAKALDVEHVCIGGASAGANLAAGAAKRLRDGDGATLAGLVLAYPLLHAALPAFSDELQATLDAAPTGTFFFTRELTVEITDHFRGDVASDDAYAFPANGSLAGMPPTYIVNAEYDTLRASGEAFADALAAAGVPVVVETEPGTGHGYLDDPTSPAASATLERMTAWLLTV
jgi:acetyl esterase/lipase